MKISSLFKIALLASLLLAPLSAQETEEQPSCDEVYDTCSTKCEALDAGLEECFAKCSEAYEMCPESEEDEEK